MYTRAQECTGLVFGMRSKDDALACVQKIEYVDLNGSGNEVEYRVTDANASRSGWALQRPQRGASLASRFSQVVLGVQNASKIMQYN